MGKIVVVAAGWLLFVACGGQSVVDEDEGGAAGEGAGPGSQGGASGQGTSGRPGGSSGSATAGSIAIGGSPGTAGNGQFGGAGNAGTTAAGSVGTAPLSRCEQPLEAGMCNAYFPSYGFNPSIRYCQRFIYGGCGGNDNRFASLGECEAACGGTNEGGCPETMPSTPSMCGEPDKVCHYQFDGCACGWNNPSCPKIDPYCPALPPADGDQSPEGDETPCVGPDCPSKVIIEYVYTCSCLESGWECSARLGGYGPR